MLVKEGLMGFANKRWGVVLSLVTALLTIGNIFIFFPGYMSNDSLGHLGQALGRYDRTDLTPPMLTLVWQAFITVTHRPATMLVFQLALLWTALGSLAGYIWVKTGSKKLSTLPLFVGLLPCVINISGVIWKDNHMAFSLLLSVVLVLWIPRISDIRVKRGMLAFCLLLILYAVLVRYNAMVAVLPIVYWTLSSARVLSGRRSVLIAVAAVCILILLAVPGVKMLAGAKSSHPAVAVMLDDISAISSPAEVERGKYPESLKRHLKASLACAEQKKVLLNNFWVCADDTSRYTYQYAQYESMQRLWLATVFRHPLQYGAYRAETYFTFLFPESGYKFIWQEGIVENDFGQHVAFPRMGNILRLYVENFGYKYFTPLFEPWFWLLMSIVCGMYAFSLAVYKKVVLALAASSLLYYLSYIPTGATIDFRYIYWPVMALTVAALLIAVEKLGRIKTPENLKT